MHRHLRKAFQSTISKRLPTIPSALPQVTNPTRSLHSHHHTIKPQSPPLAQSHTFFQLLQPHQRSPQQLTHFPTQLPLQTALFGILTPPSTPPPPTLPSDDVWLPADPSQLDYDEKNIHLDLSSRNDRQKYRILANGEKIPISPSEPRSNRLTRLGEELLALHTEADSDNDSARKKAREELAKLKIRVVQTYARKVARERYEDDCDVFDGVAEWLDGMYNYYFPQDLISVLDLTVTQLQRIYTITASLVKGWAAGAAITWLTGHQVWLFTTLYSGFVFYPYLLSYFALSSYVFINFIHIASVFMKEFPVIKEFVILFVQLHRFTTAPTYMIVKTVVKHALSLNKQEKSRSVLDTVVASVFDKLSPSSPSDAASELELMNTLEEIEERNEVKAKLSQNQKPKDESIFDQISNTIDEFTSPTNFLQELHEGLELINEETASELRSPHNKEVEILVEENLRITQDTKRDVTHVEVSAPTPVFGATIKVTMDNAKLVVHG